MIIGCPGSGKSTFARKLRDMTNLPLYYLDMLFWNADRTTVDKEVFQQRLEEILQKDQWIIDGNYNRTIELRLQHCDMVFFLDYPTEVCMEGVRTRFGKEREDIPWVEKEVDEEFMEFIQNFQENSKPKILALLEKYSDKKIITFHSRNEAEEYLRLCP